MTTREEAVASQTVDRTSLTGAYKIDPVHSRLGFVARHMVVSKVRGQFNEFEGGVDLDGANPAASSGWVRIDGQSIDTGNEQRDGHIRSNDFLALDKYPAIEFQTTSISGAGEDFEVVGDLTIRGVTRPVAFQVTFLGGAIDAYGNTRVAFEGSTVVSRREWGVSWNAALESGGVVVADKVTLEFELAAVRV